MKFTKIENKGKARLFNHHQLEFLTKSHPLVIWGLYLPVVITLPYQTIVSYSFRAPTCLLLFLSGMFVWTLTEYLLHRFVFHACLNSKAGKRFLYLIHGNHHHYPRDKQRLFMPPVPGILIASLFELFFYILLGVASFPFFSGFLLGYLIYGTMHYAIHAMRPPFSWLKPLWRNHYLHHYTEENKGFGVSSTLWDRVFGTMYESK